MSTVYSVKLQQIIDEFQLEKIFLPDDENIIVTRSDLNRPGLALSGFFGHFEPARIQLIGNCEHTYLNSFPESTLPDHIDSFMSKKPVAVIFTTSLAIFPIFIEKAKKYSSQPFELLIISPIHLGNGVGDDGFDPEFDLASEQVSRQLAQEYRKVATHYHAGFLDASKIALPSEIDREHLDESGHAALADAVYKTITESGLIEKGMDSSFCHIA